MQLFPALGLGSISLTCGNSLREEVHVLPSLLFPQCPGVAYMVVDDPWWPRKERMLFSSMVPPIPAS